MHASMVASTAESTVTKYSWASNTEPAPNHHQTERISHLERQVEDLTSWLAVTQAPAEDESFALVLLDGSCYQFLEPVVTDG